METKCYNLNEICDMLIECADVLMKDEEKYNTLLSKIEKFLEHRDQSYVVLYYP